MGVLPVEVLWTWGKLDSGFLETGLRLFNDFLNASSLVWISDDVPERPKGVLKRFNLRVNCDAFRDTPEAQRG